MSLRGCDRRILSYLDWTKIAFLPFFKCFPKNSASQSKKLCTHCPHFVPIFLSKSVLPCAVLCPHHVHQLGAERKRLCHSIQWVSQTAWKTFQWISWQERNVLCVCVCHLINISRCFPHQGWRWRFWELFLVQPSRGRSWAWRMLPAYQDPATS